MKEDYYILLIQKQLSGEILPTEQSQLKEWLNASADNRQVEKTIRRTWELSEVFSEDIDLDMEADFDKIEQRLGSAAKHEAKIRPLNRRRWVMRIAAAVLLLIVGRFVLDKYFSPAVKYQVVSTENAPSELPIDLVDGSKVWLNTNSKMTFFTTNGSDERRVKIEGEAFFDVAKDATKPFIVELPSGEVTVLGTSFSAGETADGIEVNVSTGKVKLSPKGSNQAITMTANERGVFHKKESRLVKEETATLNEIAWHTDKLVFENTPLQATITTINDHYKTSVSFKNEALATCPISATFDNKKIETVVETLATILGATIEKTAEGGYLLTEGQCQ